MHMLLYGWIADIGWKFKFNISIAKRISTKVIQVCSRLHLRPQWQTNHGHGSRIGTMEVVIEPLILWHLTARQWVCDAHQRWRTGCS